MEPLDTDMQYSTREPRPATPGSRLNLLFIFPAIGLILVLIFAADAFIFQPIGQPFDLSGVVDTLVGLMLLLFAVLIAALFWALAPRASNQ